MAECIYSQNHQKVLYVMKGYNTTSGGVIDSLRATLKVLKTAYAATTYTTYMTSVGKPDDLPDETVQEIEDLNISIIEPDRKSKSRLSTKVLTEFHRDYFSGQITKIPGIQVVVGIEPCTALTASCLRDELTEAYSLGNYRFSRSRPSKNKTSRSSSSKQPTNSRSSSSASSRSKKENYSSSSCNDDGDDRIKYVLINFRRSDIVDDLPGTKEQEFIETARDADVVISVGLTAYNNWQSIFYMDEIPHEPYIPFDPILSDDELKRVPVDIAEAKGIKRILTLNTGCNILQSEFHKNVAGVLGSIARMKADQYEANFLTWIVQLDPDLSEDDNKAIRSVLSEWSDCKALRIQFITPRTKTLLHHQLNTCNLVLMPGMFHVSGYSGLECMMSAIPCLVPEHSDVADIIRLEDSLETALLVPSFDYGPNAENEWKRKILTFLQNPLDASKHASVLKEKLKKSVLYERSQSLLLETLYGITKENEDEVTHNPKIKECTKNTNAIGNDLLVPLSELELEEELIGRGTFSIVQTAIHKTKKVAVKTINTGALTISQQDVFKTVSIMASLQHENITKLIGYALEEQRIYMVMELAEKSMNNYIAEKQNDFGEDVKLQVAMQCCAGLHHLHTRRIVHQDIKPANILLSKNMTAKIADFDIARLKTKLHSPTTMTNKHSGKQPGSPFYQPPEVYQEKAHFWSDIWSMGGTLVEWFTYQQLWSIPAGQNDTLKIPEYISKGIQPQALKNLTPDMRSILQPCLCYDKQQRPSANEMENAFKDRLNDKKFLGYKKTTKDGRFSRFLDFIKVGFVLAISLLSMTICYAFNHNTQYCVGCIALVAVAAAACTVAMCILQYCEIGWPVTLSVVIAIILIVLPYMPYLHHFRHPEEPCGPKNKELQTSPPESTENTILKLLSVEQEERINPGNTGPETLFAESEFSLPIAESQTGELPIEFNPTGSELLLSSSTDLKAKDIPQSGSVASPPESQVYIRPETLYAESESSSPLVESSEKPTQMISLDQEENTSPGIFSPESQGNTRPETLWAESESSSPIAESQSRELPVELNPAGSESVLSSSADVKEKGIPESGSVAQPSNLTDRYPNVPVAVSPDDADRVLDYYGHRRKDLSTEYRGQLIYRNNILEYEIKGDLRWRGLKTKWKWRCILNRPSTGQIVESDWHLGRATTLSDALTRISSI